jgi:hypothetical protein
MIPFLVDHHAVIFNPPYPGRKGQFLGGGFASLLMYIIVDRGYYTHNLALRSLRSEPRMQPNDGL